MQPRVLLDGLAMPEPPRWHDGRLWFSNWGTRQIVAVDLDGQRLVFHRARQEANPLCCYQSVPMTETRKSVARPVARFHSTA